MKIATTWLRSVPLLWCNEFPTFHKLEQSVMYKLTDVIAKATVKF